MGSYFVLHFGLVAGLVLLAMVLGRSERTRDLAHVAWVLVFVKLLVPAFLEVPVLAPEPVEFAAIEAPLLEAAPPTKGAVVDSIELGAADLALALEPVPAAPAAWSPLALLLAVWAVGALVCAARIVVTMLRFRRLLRGARTPSPSLSAISEQAAATLGLACAPRLCVVDARVSPALWPSIPATVVVPDGLEARLSDEEMRLVLLHEMAHYARRAATRWCCASPATAPPTPARAFERWSSSARTRAAPRPSPAASCPPVPSQANPCPTGSPRSCSTAPAAPFARTGARSSRSDSSASCLCCPPRQRLPRPIQSPRRTSHPPRPRWRRRSRATSRSRAPPSAG